MAKAKGAAVGGSAGDGTVSVLLPIEPTKPERHPAPTRDHARKAKLRLQRMAVDLGF
jgi:hypothetical protein